jgi:hypothetical protein
MAKNLLGSILGALLKTAAGTPKKKTTRTTASNAAGPSAKPKSATELEKNFSPKMKKLTEEVWNKPTTAPKGWTTTKSETIYSSK